jgi:hypothetical protein
LSTYEEATGTKINIRKSRTLALGSLNTSLPIMDVPYFEEMKILGVHVTNTINATEMQN